MKVSCIMPTANRRKFLPIALECYRRQTYANKELVVVDDGDDPIDDLLEGDDILYYKAPKTPLGEKRNIACRIATGDVIFHWDDDDWYADNRIETSVSELLKSGKQVFGYHSLIFYDVHLAQAWMYNYPSPGLPYACGASLCYFKTYWMKHPFKPVAVVEDNYFNNEALKNEAIYSKPGGRMLVATIHSGNSSARNLSSCYTKLPLDELPEGVHNLWSRTLQ